MSAFAESALHPDVIIVWLAVGLIAGWFAGLVLKGSGYGSRADINLTAVGAVIGGVVFGLIVTGGEPDWSSIAVAFVGACISVAVVRFAVPARSSPATVRPALARLRRLYQERESGFAPPVPNRHHASR